MTQPSFEVHPRNNWAYEDGCSSCQQPVERLRLVLRPTKRFETVCCDPPPLALQRRISAQKEAK